MPDLTFSIEAPHDFIELHQLLKVLGLVESGGQAKLVINQGLVLLNGETETRKRKKLSAGDKITFNGEKITVLAKEN